MEKEKMKYYQYIKTLYNMSEADIDQCENIIHVFNEYVSSNNSFKYNRTYLNDSIDDFKDIYRIWKNKKNKIIQFKKYIDEHYESLKGWYMIIDHLFLLEDDYFGIIVDKLEDNETVSIKKGELEKELQLFNLHNIDKWNIIIKYYLETDSGHIEFTEKHDLNKEIEINNVVKSQLKERVQNDEDK